MPIALRHRDDAHESLAPLRGLAVRREHSAEVMAALQQRSVGEIEGRLDRGHRAYVAWVDCEAAAWGWVATESATIGELKVEFTIPRGDRYLWNFVTLPAFRGRGIYPRLLEGIVDAESVDGEPHSAERHSAQQRTAEQRTAEQRTAMRFWIAYAPENHASGTGILKAGFALVAELSFDDAGTPVVKDLRQGGGAEASRLLGLADTEREVAQCWKCARHKSASEMHCRSGHCSCDYQVPTQECAA